MRAVHATYSRSIAWFVCVVPCQPRRTFMIMLRQMRVAAACCATNSSAPSAASCTAAAVRQLLDVAIADNVPDTWPRYAVTAMGGLLSVCRAHKPQLSRTRAQMVVGL